MKRVTIFGSFNGESIGDTAILIGLISSLKNINSEIEITVLVAQNFNLKNELELFNIEVMNVKQVVAFYQSNKESIVENFKWFCNRVMSKVTHTTIVNKQKVREVLGSSDYLLIGGGNLIMDIYPEWPFILQDICLLAKKMKVRYSFIGVGAGPINNKISKITLKNCLNYAEKIYFRDINSLKFIKENLEIEIGKVGPDCAFGITVEKESKKNNNKGDYILLNLASVYSNLWPYKSEEKFNRYIENISEYVKIIMDKYKCKKIVIYNTNYPLDEYAVKKFIDLNNIDIDIEYKSGRLTVYQIIQLCKGAKFSIVTRLHAGILCALADTKVIAVSYQPKVKDVLLEYGVTDKINEMEDFLNKRYIVDVGEIDENKLNPNLTQEFNNIVKMILEI